MKDYLAQVEKLRTDAADAALIRDLATDPQKRQLFDRVANHLSLLADQVEMAILERNAALLPCETVNKPNRRDELTIS